jgi:SH3-like domain-containing protein
MVATAKSKENQVEYLYDAKGKPVKVLMSYDKYIEMIEDMNDLKLSDARMLESDVPLPLLKRRGKVHRSA